MAKVQVFIPEPPAEFSSESFRQINLAIESLQNQLNTSYQRETKEEADAFSYFLK